MKSKIDWPDRLKLRDTNVFADEGQRIFTTATGYGYERQEYVRADLYQKLEADLAFADEQCAKLETLLEPHIDWTSV